MSSFSEREKKKCLIQILEAEDDQGLSLLSLFRERDDLDKKEVFFGAFKNCLERILPSISRDEISQLFEEFKVPGHEKANYQMLLNKLQTFRKKKNILNEILDQIMDNLSSKDSTLFDLFEKADTNGDGTLSRREFLKVMDAYDVYFDEDQMDDFFFFLDVNNDGSISYKELNTYFTKYVKKKGKDISGLTKSNYFKDPKNYWGKKIFQEAIRYINQNKLTVPSFFKQYGMESDFGISQFEFQEAMGVLIRNLDKNDLYKLISEMEDKEMKKISISKFQDVYNAIATENPGAYDRGGTRDFEQNQKYTELLKTLAAMISSKYVSYDDFFTKYGYNRHLKTINENKFDTAVYDLNLRLPPDEIRILKNKFDPTKTGILALDDLFDIKPDSSLQNQYTPATLNPREKVELKSLTDEIALHMKKRDINLLLQFTKYDYRKEGELTDTEFFLTLKDNQMDLGAQDKDLLVKAYGDPRTKKVNYKNFCDAMQTNIQNLPQPTTKGPMIDPEKLAQKQKLLYTAIRQQHATMEDLFSAYDRNQDNTISKPEFIQMIKSLKVEMTIEEMEALFDLIDSKRLGKIYFVNISLHFKEQIEADSKEIMNGILRAFVSASKSYYEVLKTFPQSGNHIKFIDFMDALQSISRKINMQDMQFLLSHLNIKTNSQREINWDEFGTALQSAARRLKLLNPIEEEHVFRKLDRQGSFRQDGMRQDSMNNRQGSFSESPTKKTGVLDKLKIKLALNTQQKILDFWRALDRDGNKKASVAEFKRAVTRINTSFTDAELNQAFREIDLSDRGYFTSADLLERLSDTQQINLSQIQNSQIQNNQNQASPGLANTSKGFGKSVQEIIDRTMWAKSIFENMYDLLQRKNATFKSYFDSPDQRMNIIAVKLALNKLEVNTNNEVNRLLNDLCDDEQPNLVNLNYFERCYNYHKDRYEVDLNRNRSPLDNYQQIREALKRKDLTFDDTFAKADIGNRGTIGVGAFKAILEDDLRVFIDTTTINRIIDETADREGRLSVTKLREGINVNRGPSNFGSDRDESVEDLIKKLQTTMKNNNMTIDRLFNMFDTSKDKIIEWEEFQKMMLKINPDLSRNENLKVFRFMDKNGNGQISSDEFKRALEDETVRTERAMQSLKDMIRVNRIDAQRAFDMFDKNSNGSIEFSEFNDVLNSIDPSLSQDERKIIFRRLDINQDGQIKRNEFLKHFGTGYETAGGPGAGNLRTQKLIDDLKNTLRPRDRNETLKLFEFVDANNNGKISPDEFTRFAQRVDPTLSTNETFEMFKLIDKNNDQVITWQEFVNEFNVNRYDVERPGQNRYDSGRPQTGGPYQDQNQNRYDSGRPQTSGPYQDNRGPQANDTIEKTRFASALFEEIAYCLKVEKVNFSDFFFSYDNKLEKQALKKKLEDLGFAPDQLSYDTMDRLGQAVADPREYNKIDLNEFKRCFDYHKDGGRTETGVIRKRRLDQVIQDIRGTLNREGYNLNRLVNNLDKSGYGTSPRQEFNQFLLERLNLKNNTNLKILAEAVLHDQEGRTVNLRQFENLINSGSAPNTNANVNAGGIYQDRRYEDERDRKTGLPPDFGGNRDYRAGDQYGYGQDANRGTRPGETYYGPEALLEKLKSTIERSGVSVEQVYKRFNPNGTEFMTYDQFYNGVKNLNNELSREEIQSVFRHLDKENAGRLSKFRFMVSLGKISPAEIPKLLSWARPLFQEINRCLQESRSDIFKTLKPHQGLVDREDFRQGLYFIGLDTNKHQNDLQNISEVLLQGRPNGLNFDAFEDCLKKASQPEVQEWKQKTNFTEDDLNSIHKMFLEIAKFMMADNITFEQLFQAKDPQRAGYITEADLKKALYDELYITENPKILLLIEYCKNPQGNIDLLVFKENLKKGEKATATVLSLDVFLKGLKDRFKNNNDAILKLFDNNNNGSISRKEFVDCCVTSLGIEKDSGLFYFSQLDPKNKGEITSMDFRDALGSSDPNTRQIFAQLKEFIHVNHANLLRNLDALDDSRNQMLTPSQLKIAFSNSQFLITLEQLDDIALRLNIKKDFYNKLNYMEFIDKIMKTDQTQQNLADIDDILNRLKTQVLAKNLDLIPIFNRHDTKGDQTISIKEAVEDLGTHQIFLNKDEKDLIFPLLNPINDRINYYDFSRLIFNGRDKSKTKEVLLREAAWAKNFINEIKYRMREKGMNTTRLFALRPNEDLIPVADFNHGLEYLGFRNNSNEVKDLGNLLKENDRAQNVSIVKFEFLLDNIDKAQQQQQGPQQGGYQQGGYQQGYQSTTGNQGYQSPYGNNQQGGYNSGLQSTNNLQSTQGYTAEESKILEQRFTEIRGFMQEDRKTFDQIFPKYDRNRTGFVSREEMSKILSNELGLDPTEALNRFINLMADKRGMISLEFVKSNLEKPHTMTSSVRFEQPKGAYNQQTQQPLQPVYGQNQSQVYNPSYQNPPQNAQQSSSKGYQDPYQSQKPQYPGTSGSIQNLAYNAAGMKPPQQNPNQNTQSYGSQNYNNPQYNNTQSYNNNPQGYNTQSQGQFSVRDDGPIEYSGDLVNDIKRFFRNKRLTNQQRFAYFGGEATGTIPKQDFINRVRSMDIRNASDNVILSLFERLDANHTGQLSENEFRLAFDEQEVAYQTRDVNLSKELSDEILQLFREIDTDNSNFLTIDELVRSLSKLGANPTSEEANRLFRELDRNGDGKISFQEFRMAMEEKLKKDILHLEGLLSDLREEFKRADVYNRGVLTPQQLYQALLNLKIELRQDEFSALVQTIDRDRSGTIDIDEFLGFIMTPQDQNAFNKEADAAIMNIKRSKKLSLLELMGSFKNMPHNFMTSFTRDLTRKLLNLPSSTMKPKLNTSGVFHTDLIPNFDKPTSSYQRTSTLNSKNLYNIKPIPSVLCAKITANLATGVPIPAEQNVNRFQSIVGRELKAVIYSKTTKKFIGNIATLQVEWDPAFEDRWNFLPTKTANENSLLLRLSEFNPSKEYDAGLVLVFEFVLFFKKNDQIIEMSSSWAEVELSELRQTKILDLKLKGGSPLREININEADVLTNRKGWRHVVKTLSKPIQSKLKIEIKSADKIDIEIRNDMEFLPGTILINRNALALCKTYRDYMGGVLKDSQEKGLQIDLNNDILGRTFRKVMDCPDTWHPVMRFWNLSVLAVSVRAKEPANAIESIKKLLKNLCLMFTNLEFNFRDTDPCARVLGGAGGDVRRNLLNEYLENSLVDMQIKPETSRKNPSAQSTFKPFNINELLEDESDLALFGQLQNIRSNTTSQY